MKKLMIILFGAALLVAPFAETSDARGGRGRGRTGISGKVASRGKKGSAKEQQRMRELTRCEERNSLVDGQLGRRFR
jgi:hypothetical protein